MTKNSSGKYFWTKYIFLLLAAFVFVMGMMLTKPVIAAPDAGLNPIAYGTDSWGGYSYEVRIEGLQGIKYVNSIAYDNETRNDNFYTAKLVKNAVFKAHYIFNPVSLEEFSGTHKVGHVDDKSMDKVLDAFRQRYKSRNWTISITLMAMEKDKVLNKLSKTFSNLTDNCVEYKLPPKTTQVIITVSGKQTLVDANKGRFTSEIEKGERYIFVTTPISSGNEKGSGTDTNTDKLSDSNSTGVDSNGNGIAYLGGGLFAVMVGGAAVFFYTGAGGAAGAGATGSMPETPEPPEPEPEPPTPPAPPEPDYYLYKDPAGFETLYMKDPETGNWYNYQDYEEGYRVPVDMDKLQEYDAQRQKDVKWNQDQMQKLENRETGLDKELKQEYQDMLEREKHIQEEMKQRQEEYKRYLEERQANDQKDVDKWTKRADAWDTAMTVAEGVQTVADIGVDILATVTAPAGGGYIADAYALTKNVAGSAMEGLTNKERTFGGGLKEGITKGLIDVAQNHSGTKWQKVLSYVGGESIKGGIDAGVKGESIVKGAVKGALQGGTKLGVDAVSKKIGDKIAKNSADSLKHAYEHAGDIRKRIAPQVSERSAKALQEMNIQKHLANFHKAEHQTLANTITNGVARNLLPKVFG